ncbi:MAG: alpha/beta fold hydrolase, partial [Gammaproteobacteria bacterium]|nr:alpha/beta fold hydrolase [Gammaproteobacteria bacterium]
MDIRHCTIAGLRWQRDSAEPVIALHGWLDNAATWSRVAPALDQYNLCAIDFAGHGKSDHRPANAAYHFIDNVADVIAVADRLGWKRFSLLGHSLGASVATLVAGTIPERIRSLVCIEGFGPLTTPPEQAPEQLRK